MTRAAVEEVLYLMDAAFDGDEECLLTNLRSVPDAAWGVAPPGMSRSVRQIVGHVAACKWMYDNHAFGDAALTWDDAAAGLGVSIEEMQSAPDLGPRDPGRERVMEWLREGHRRLREHVAALTDEELAKPRRVNWGGTRETRWIVANLIRHDAYHAGEVNYVRGLLAGGDAWEWTAE